MRAPTAGLNSRSADSPVRGGAAVTAARGSPPLGNASRRSAVIVRTSLPGGLERLRRMWLADAAAGVPAHLTLLYPFIEPGRLQADVRALLQGVASEFAPFDYRLVGPALFPDTAYVAVDPAARFVELQAALARAFPEYPIYGPQSTFAFVPHVSVAEGEAA
jgi:2'-5' RNA ligase